MQANRRGGGAANFRQNSVWDFGKCASERFREFQTGDAISARSDEGELTAVGRPTQFRTFPAKPVHAIVIARFGKSLGSRRYPIHWAPTPLLEVLRL